jgi:putative transposase
MDYKSNRNVVYSCKYHVVWRPKYRRRVLVEGIDERLSPTLWTNSHFVSTVGGAPPAMVKQYIESQRRSESR